MATDTTADVDALAAYADDRLGERFTEYEVLTAGGRIHMEVPARSVPARMVYAPEDYADATDADHKRELDRLISRIIDLEARSW